MKKILLIVLTLLTFSCSVMKYESANFIGNEFVFKGGQVGDSVFKFSNKNVWYSERGGLFSGTGTWELTEDRKFIVIRVTTTGPDPLSGKKGTVLKYQIKNKETLVGEDGKIFIRKK